eukprot:TRINITY_DN1146_c0_g1_i1.p1 TRINITY_DN1146_c0_g1~~TRINITY_DN1146_c0_g1_i1.p1  ORF type:complete len:194 (+),score=59.16 TRINITY_DN1146_c0_g1_i1:51-584(+)
MELVELNENVSVVECLNQQPDHPVDAMWAGRGALRSDCDEQLFLYVEFRNPVKLHSVVFTGLGDGTRPNHVKLYANVGAISFDMVEQGEPCTQHADLEPLWQLRDGRMVATLQTRFAKFQSVSKLGIFIGGNVGDEESTSLLGLGFSGQLVGTERANHKINMAGHEDQRHSLGGQGF